MNIVLKHMVAGNFKLLIEYLIFGLALILILTFPCRSQNQNLDMIAQISVKEHTLDHHPIKLDLSKGYTRAVDNIFMLKDCVNDSTISERSVFFFSDTTELFLKEKTIICLYCISKNVALVYQEDHDRQSIISKYPSGQLHKYSYTDQSKRDHSSFYRDGGLYEQLHAFSNGFETYEKYNSSGSLVHETYTNYNNDVSIVRMWNLNGKLDTAIWSKDKKYQGRTSKSISTQSFNRKLRKFLRDRRGSYNADK